METMEHKIGSTVTMTGTPVLRVNTKSFKVVSGDSCTACAFIGLGHKLCPHIKCSQNEREDGRSVVYQEVE